MKRFACMVVVMLFFSASGAFAQKTETETEFWDKYYWEKYYSDKTAKEIWSDYVEITTRLNQFDDLVHQINNIMREPFKSWAVETFLKYVAQLQKEGAPLTLPVISLLLTGDFPQEVKSKSLEVYLSDAPTYTYESTLIRRMIDLVEGFGHRNGNFKDRYKEILINKIFADPDFAFLPNYTLGRILQIADTGQRKQAVAQMIMNNNPSHSDLATLIYQDIDFYSDNAKNMLQSRSDGGRNLSREEENTLYLIRSILTQKMMKWP